MIGGHSTTMGVEGGPRIIIEKRFVLLLKFQCTCHQMVDKITPLTSQKISNQLEFLKKFYCLAFAFTLLLAHVPKN